MRSLTNSTTIQDTQVNENAINLLTEDFIPGIQNRYTEEQKYSISQIQSFEQTILMYAKEGEKSKFQILLDSNKDIDLSAIKDDVKQYSVLHYLVFNNQTDSVKSVLTHYTNYLIAHGESTSDALRLFINQSTSEGFTVIHFASYRGNLGLLELFESHKADLMCTNKHGMNIMHIAAQGDHPVGVVFAYDRGIKIDSKDLRGGTPLHWSCYYGCEQSSIYLISMLPTKSPYQPLNAFDYQKLTPLHLAVMSGNARLVKKLLLAGADRSIIGKDGTALEMAIRNDYQNIATMLSKKEPWCWTYYNIKQGFERNRRNTREVRRYVLFYLFFVGSYELFNWKDSWDQQKEFENWKNIGFIPPLLLNILLYLILVLMQPGFLQQKQVKLLELLRKLDCYDICPVCVCIRLPRSRHCEICERCVMVYDHHCPWINNCVGARNQGVFVLFISVLLFNLGSIITLIVFFFKEDDDDKWLYNKFQEWKYEEIYNYLKWIILGFNLLFGILFFLALCILLFTQLGNLFYGKTTLERYIEKVQSSNQSSIFQKSGSHQSIQTSLIEQIKKPDDGCSYGNMFNMCCVNTKQYRNQEREKIMDYLD